MSAALRSGLLLAARNSLSCQSVRSVWQKKIKIEVYPSLQERLAELDHTKDDPELYAPVDIGLPERKPSRREQLTQRLLQVKSLRGNALLEKQSRNRDLKIDIDEVQAVWETTSGPHHIQTLAQHYGIFTDLYGNAYFVPRVILKINYDYDDDKVSSVYRGNIIKPIEAAAEPSVQFQSKPDDLWTLILTNPDGNLLDNDFECLHWFIGNIQGGELASGEVMCDYLQPFPPRGTGYHRYVFVLYKQDGRIDFSKFKRQQPCLSLKERSFSTLDFYRELQDDLTPAGLAWFQADWDSSLTSFFHNTLKMLEPVYEYEFPEPYVSPQKYFPLKKPFQVWQCYDFTKGVMEVVADNYRYMDLHRDPKEISKEILLQRLKKLNPFEREPPVLPFPAAQPIDHNLTSWERRELKKQRLGMGKYRDLFRGSNMPE